MPKKSVRIKCKNSNVFFRKRKRVYLCDGAHQESPQWIAMCTQSSRTCAKISKVPWRLD